MESVAARLNSFKKSKRVKNPDKKSSTISLKWPHPSDFKANPETLAEAGFYFDPAYDDPDNVTCFTCDKELGGWEADDDPYLLHWRKCGQHCCWASVRCGLVTELDASGRFASADKTRYPTHKAMEKARLDTFSAGKGWIHDKVKGHGASSSMMARAGFVFTPQHSGDDLATCLYCNTSLSGWDEEDDPMEEHRKRASKSDVSCPFFSTAETSRPQSTKPPSKAQSKPPSRSASKSKYQDIVMPTKTFDGEEEESDTVEPAKAAKSATKTPRKPRSTSSSSTKKTTAKTPKAKSRSTSRSGLKDVVEDEDEDVEIELPATVKKKSRSKSVVRSDIQTEEDENVEVHPPPMVKKKPRSRSKSVARQVVEIEVDDDDNSDVQMEPPPTVKKKSRTQSKSIPKPEIESEAPAEQEENKKPSRSKSRKPVQQTEDEAEEEVPRKSSRGKSKAPAVSETEEVARKPPRSKAKASVAPSPTEEEVPRKPSRAKPKHKAPDSENDEICIATAKPTKPLSLQEEAPKPPVKPKHQRTASKSKVKAPVAVSDTESVEQEEPITFVQPKKKSSNASKQLPVEPAGQEEPVTVVQSKKPSSKTKPSPPVEAADLFNDDVVLDNNDPLPSPPPSSKSTPAAELAPLFVPKRKTAAPAPAKSPSKSTTKEKPVSKSKPAPPGTPKPMKVVEISSDDDSDAPISEKENNPKDGLQRSKETIENTHIPLKPQSLLQLNITQPQFKTPPRPASAQGRFGKKPIIVETVQPPEVLQSPSPPVEPEEDKGDVSMDDVERDVDQQMEDVPAPSTPPRPTIRLTPPNGVIPNVDSQPDLSRSSTPPGSSQNIASETKESPFMPPLSRLPFIHLQGLSDAELDMTVEEWIRYQMEVEFDKFRRDGERELQLFRKKAEDVRKVIEGL